VSDTLPANWRGFISPHTNRLHQRKAAHTFAKVTEATRGWLRSAKDTCQSPRTRVRYARHVLGSRRQQGPRSAADTWR